MNIIHFDMLYRLDICTFYFYGPCCFRFSSHGIYKNLGFPLSTITFTMLLQSTALLITISINVFICFKYYNSLKSVFQLNYTFWPRFYIQISFKYKTPLLLFLIRTTIYRKKTVEKSFFCCTLFKYYWITYRTRLTSHAIWVDEIVDVMISIKKIRKSRNIFKK